MKIDILLWKTAVCKMSVQGQKEKKKTLVFRSGLTEHIYSSRWFYFFSETFCNTEDVLQKSSFMHILFEFLSEAH